MVGKAGVVDRHAELAVSGSKKRSVFSIERAAWIFFSSLVSVGIGYVPVAQSAQFQGSPTITYFSVPSSTVLFIALAQGVVHRDALTAFIKRTL
jgi:hypothetical protein